MHTGDRTFASQYLTEYAPLFVHDPAMREIREVMEDVADTNATVLIRGETGVGKEIVARSLHAASPRHDKPFIKVNCAALPAELLESELFGHEKGAFTGAYQQKRGKFEFAHRGTIFLDEVGELPLSLQAKLLHVLHDFQFSRIGGQEVIRVDVRVVAATNRDLEVALRRGEFREDLYYRLNVVEIRIPPLRERKEEIAVLTALFLARFKERYGRQVELSPEALALFREYAWPGNIRELENMVCRVVALGHDRLVRKELQAFLRPDGSRPDGSSEPPKSPQASAGGEADRGLRVIARRAAREAELVVVLETLERVHWNRREAARMLRVSYKTLLNRIAEYGIKPTKQR